MSAQTEASLRRDGELTENWSAAGLGWVGVGVGFDLIAMTDRTKRALANRCSTPLFYQFLHCSRCSLNPIENNPNRVLNEPNNNAAWRSHAARTTQLHGKNRKVRQASLVGRFGAFWKMSQIERSHERFNGLE